MDSRFPGSSSCHRLKALGPALSLVTIALACGCDTKSFLDPSELGRYQHDALVLPIVSQVDPAIEPLETPWGQAHEPTLEDLKPVAGDYRISPNDLLAVSVSDLNQPNSETLKQVRVSESGNISLAYLPQPIRAAGLTEIQLENAIIEAYRANQLVQNANVSATVVEARGRAFKIFGAIQTPGEYLIADSNFRMLDALVLSHGVGTPFVDYLYVVRQNQDFTANLPPPPAATTRPSGATSAPTTGPSSEELAPKTEANSPLDLRASIDAGPSAQKAKDAAAPVGAAKVIFADQSPSEGGAFDGFRDPAPEQNVRVLRIPYQALRRGDLRYNIAIHPHDVIYAAEPESGYYFVGGHVARGGSFALTGQKVTLKDAIIASNMLDGLAIPQRTDIIRQIRPDHQIWVRVDLAKIFSGDEPDVYLKPGDDIMVGTNAVAPFLAAIRGSFRITYGFGFLYDRNYAYSTQFGVP